MNDVPKIVVGQSPGADFDRVARVYRVLEMLRFGNALQRSRVALIDRLGQPKRALLLGDGDGRLLAELGNRCHDCTMTSVDLSQQMLLLQKKRCGEHVGYIRADTRNLPLGETFDLIITAYHLDCFESHDLELVLREISRLLNVEGRLYVVDFVQPESGWRHHWTRLWIRILIIFFRSTAKLQTRRLPDIETALIRQGFDRTHSHCLNGWIVSSIWKKQEKSTPLLKPDQTRPNVQP